LLKYFINIAESQGLEAGPSSSSSIVDREMPGIESESDFNESDVDYNPAEELSSESDDTSHEESSKKNHFLYLTDFENMYFLQEGNSCIYFLLLLNFIISSK